MEVEEEARVMLMGRTKPFAIADLRDRKSRSWAKECGKPLEAGKGKETWVSTVASRMSEACQYSVLAHETCVRFDI